MADGAGTTVQDGFKLGDRIFGRLLTSRRVLGDVLGSELDTARRKKLFRRVTRLSGRGPVDGDAGRRHLILP